MRQIALLLLVLAVLGCPAASADGLAWKGGDYSSLRPLEMGEQRAAIAHSAGTQRMVIAIDIDLEEADDAVWIFPIPARGSRAKLDVVDSFPKFSGHDVMEAAAEDIDDLIMLATGTQLYPLPYLIFAGMTAIGGKGAVSQYAEIEKWGIHAELVSANSVDDLDAYLRGKKAALAREELAAFEPYLSEEHALVVVWIADRQEVLRQFPEYGERYAGLYGRAPCVYVEFPTELPFYPMRPTSAYGNASIPVRLFIVGFVEPRAVSSLAGRMEVSYWVQRRPPSGAPAGFMDGQRDRGRYTAVSIDAPAREFTEDLRFGPASSFGLRYASWVSAVQAPPIRALILVAFVAILSYVSGGITGIILHRRWKAPAAIGLMNVMTILGVALAMRQGTAFERERLQGRRTTFFVVFSLTYMAVTFIVRCLLVAPL